jgi:hypothetical protein
MPEIPTNEPLTLRAGDTWQWKRSLTDYPAGTWTLKYRFKNAAGGFEVVAAADGTDHSVTVTAATTTGYAAAKYSWIAWVEAGAEKYTIDQGTLQVLPDLRTGTATAAQDTRSHARKVLDALEALIEGKATRDQMAYTINGRSLTRLAPEELLKWRSQYVAEVAAEEQAQAIASGHPATGNKLQVRL